MLRIAAVQQPRRLVQGDHPVSGDVDDALAGAGRGGRQRVDRIVRVQQLQPRVVAERHGQHRRAPRVDSQVPRHAEQGRQVGDHGGRGQRSAQGHGQARVV